MAADDKPKSYLGDGVYAQYDGYGILLTTENGRDITNFIALEPEVYDNLTKFVASLQKKKG